MPSPLASQITSHLSAKSLYPTTDWTNAFVDSQKSTTPLAASKQTALFRLLASDITQTLRTSRESTFPSDILDANIQERRISGPVPVQVLDIEDIGRSRWAQIEAIETAERGETTRGREVIRVVPGEEGLSDPDAGSSGPHKLLLQDAKGGRAYAFEMSSIEGVNLSMKIGAKLVLQGTLLARGMLLLEPATVVILGGKIDSLHSNWKETRKQRLKDGIEQSSAT